MQKRLLTRKLKSERTKGNKITIKTFLTYDDSRLIVQIVTPNSTIERNYPNSSVGEHDMKLFLSQFKTLRDINNYLGIGDK